MLIVMHFSPLVVSVVLPLLVATLALALTDNGAWCQFFKNFLPSRLCCNTSLQALPADQMKPDTRAITEWD
ncbi:hypothetical protein PI124_g10399 [Phytophthora idaei]|nr:hypothetical protein PI125_g6370 [Phytophthora idaei]KAG3162342.1 hypothetical protein PI126_g5999 [Phytophthora idaei]KAG3244824.1 hypothetical protein PI124_g10399 [Phytophthora idaei]